MKVYLGVFGFSLMGREKIRAQSKPRHIKHLEINSQRHIQTYSTHVQPVVKNYICIGRLYSCSPHRPARSSPVGWLESKLFTSAFSAFTGVSRERERETYIYIYIYIYITSYGARHCVGRAWARRHRESRPVERQHATIRTTWCTSSAFGASLCFQLCARRKMIRARPVRCPVSDPRGECSYLALKTRNE